MNDCIVNHGQEISKDFNKVIHYELRDGHKKDTIVIDFKNKYNYNTQHGIVYLKEHQHNYNGPAAPI
jgi:hypothetical protein